MSEEKLTFNVIKLLEEEGYIKEGDDNVIHAEKAFFAARVMRWIHRQVQDDPDFNLPAYLTMLMYYKLGTAELEFKEDGSELLYKMKPDTEMNELVNSIIKSSNELAAKAAKPTGPEEPTKVTRRTPNFPKYYVADESERLRLFRRGKQKTKLKFNRGAPRQPRHQRV